METDHGVYSHAGRPRLRIQRSTMIETRLRNGNILSGDLCLNPMKLAKMLIDLLPDNMGRYFYQHGAHKIARMFTATSL